MEKVNLPPELCRLHTGIKGNLWRGAVRLPSVLYHLEKALLALELRDLIGIPISCFKVLEALTSGACDMKFSYEQLELLGDSFLKFTASLYLYEENLELGKESLGKQLFDLAFGGRMRAFAAAIFLDSGLDIDRVWKVFRHLLSPLATPDTLTIPPMIQLENLCEKDALELKILNSQSSTGIFHVEVLLNETTIASFEDENRRTARRLAAIKAVYCLTEDIGVFPEFKEF